MSENLGKGEEGEENVVSDHRINNNDGATPERKKLKLVESPSTLSKSTNESCRDQLLYMEHPVSVKEFITKKLGCDDGTTDSMHFTFADTLYQSIETAPSVSRNVAMKHLAPALDGVSISAGESDCTGYAVVIVDGKNTSSGGLPKKERLFEAIGLTGAIMENREITMEEITVEARDFTECAFFQYTKDEFDDMDDDDVEEEEIRAHQSITNVLVQHLTDHFKFEFDWPEDGDPIASAPVLYGGRAADGNIVAIAAMRVNT